MAAGADGDGHGGAARGGTGPDGEGLRVDIVEFLPSGGMFQFAFHLGEALAARGHRVRLLTGPRPELASRVAGFEVVSAFATWHPNDGLDDPAPVRKVRRAVRALRLAWAWLRLLGMTRADRPDVVHLGEFRYPLDAFCAALLGRYGGQRVLADTAHNPLPYDVTSPDEVEKTDPLTMRGLRAAYGAMHVVYTLADTPKAQLLEAFPQVRRTLVCGHGEYNAFADGHEPVPAERTGPEVLYFGSWTRYKNLPLLLDAFEQVVTSVPGARLTVAGPVMADVDLPALQRRAADLPGVDLRPGYVDIADVPALFDRARVVALPYELVNVSGVLHLAYTFARPVVATDVGAMRNVVDDGRTGLLCATDATSLAEALVTVLTDAPLAGRMGRGAAAFVRAESSWKAVAAVVDDGYRQALHAVGTDA